MFSKQYFLSFSLFLICNTINISDGQSVCMSQSQCTVDTSSPILITDTYSEDWQDSSFGYSVSLLKNNIAGSNKARSLDPSGWVFVGAPKGNPYRQYEQVPLPTRDPGVIWRCSLGSSNEVCETVDLQHPSRQGQAICKQRYQHQCEWNENQNESWFGGSMSISPSRSLRTDAGGFVGCGFRWQRKYRPQWNREENSDLVNGICYWLPLGSLSSSLTTIQPVELLPFKDEDKKYYTVYDERTGKRVSDYEYYYGEAGFSSHMTEDNRLILGAPGIHTWSGSVVYYETPQAAPVILKPEVDSRINALDLYGYAVTSGRLYDSTTLIFAAGAPRARNLLGSVLMFTATASNLYLLKNQPTLQGKQLGSYFGFTLNAIDIDGDGIDELFVGAPFYSLIEKDNSIQGKGDHGCVEIFSLHKGDAPLSLYSTKVGARFGSAIASLGDINNDKFKDFAVGAPYEDDGRGAVYIYHGRKGGFSFKDYVQIVKPSDVTIPGVTTRKAIELYGFGSAMHGDVDIDDNGTPDLVIGSFLSNSIVVHRTLPTLIFDPVQIAFQISGNRITKFNRNDDQFIAYYCIKYSIKPQPKHATTLKLWNRFTVDKTYKRFTILPDNRNRRQERNLGFETEFLIEVSQQQCISLSIKKEKQFEPNIPYSKLQINVEAQVWYNETNNLPKETITYAISKESIRNFGPRVVISGSKKFKDFCVYCPLAQSQSKTESLSIANDDCKDSGTAECESELQFKAINVFDENNIKPGYMGNYPFVIGSSKYITLQIIVRNKGETAYSPIMDINKARFPEEIRLIEKRGCDVVRDAESELLRCKIGQPLHRNDEVTQEMQLDVRSLFARDVADLFRIEISVYPQDKPKITKVVNIELLAEAKILLTGSIDTIQSSISDKSNINILHRYTAYLTGKSSITSVKMKFMLPIAFTAKETKGKQRFILIAKPTGLMCTPTVGSFDEFYVHKASESTNSVNGTVGIISRTKRDTYPSLTGKETFGIHCDQQWECMQVNCETRLEAGRSVNVEFVMQIDNKVARNLVKKEHKEIVVKSQGYVGILTEKIDDYKGVANSYTTITLTLEDEFPVWIAFVAGIGGLLLLLLITLCLAKCGFFRRKTKENLKAMKSKSENDALLGQSIPMQESVRDVDSE